MLDDTFRQDNGQLSESERIALAASREARMRRHGGHVVQATPYDHEVWQVEGACVTCGAWFHGPVGFIDCATCAPIPGAP